MKSTSYRPFSSTGKRVHIEDPDLGFDPDASITCGHQE